MKELCVVEYVDFDYTTYILGVYDSLEKAEERKNKISEENRGKVFITLYDINKDCWCNIEEYLS